MMPTNKDKEPQLLLEDPSSQLEASDKRSAAAAAPGTIKRFPFRLHEMLCDVEKTGDDDVVSWLPCGTKFKVKKHKEFAERVMPLYCRHTRYKSFLRQLSMYKFVRINDGPMRGCYHHPLFLRDRLDLIEQVNRNDRGEPSSFKNTTASKEAKKLAATSKKMSSRRTTEPKKGRMATSSLAPAPIVNSSGLSMSASDASSNEEEGEFELFDFGTNDAVEERMYNDIRKLDAAPSSSTSAAVAARMGDHFTPSFGGNTSHVVAQRFRESSLATHGVGAAPVGLFELKNDSSSNAPSPKEHLVPPSHPHRRRNDVAAAAGTRSIFESAIQVPDDIVAEIIRTFGRSNKEDSKRGVTPK